MNSCPQRLSEFPDSLESPRRGFLEALRVRNYSASTLRIYGHSVRIFFDYLCGRGIDDVREVTRQVAQEYQGWLVAGGKYQTWTIHTLLRALRRFYEHLERTDAILINPWAGFVMPKPEKRLPRNVLTEEEVKAILRAPNTQKAVGIRDRAMLEMFYSTGIRLSEMLCLTLHDVDTKNGFVRINKGKGGKDRVVPMGDRAGRWLRLYLFKVRGEWSKTCREERSLWLSRQGNHPRICKQTIAVALRKYLRAAGITHPVSPHTFRHTCATHLVAAGANIAHVQKLLGHRSLQSTQIYTRVSIPEVAKTYHRAHPRARLPPSLKLRRTSRR